MPDGFKVSPLLTSANKTVVKKMVFIFINILNLKMLL